jgi:uncharacterized delta-60 repeat protein
VVLDGDVAIFDADLSATHYAGATLTLSRNGGANAQDQFSATGTLGALAQGAALVVGGTTIGTVTTNSGGTLVLTFNSVATNAVVNSAMQQIAYANASEAPPASVQIDWIFSDGNSGAQGSGGALTATGSATVNMAAVNDAPTLTGSASLANIDEDATGNAGTLVSALIAGYVTDSDAEAVNGIAVTAVDDTNGTWQWSSNGGASWTSFGTVSATRSHLLAADVGTRVRFVPGMDWSGTIGTGLTFRAWDQTSGTAGQAADTSSNGGSTAFSSATASAGITVMAVNDAPSFRIGDGIVTTAVGSADDYAQAIAVQPDGKVLVGGTATTTTDDFALVRYNRDGTLDTSFGSGGRVTTDFAGAGDVGRSIALQADGRILMAGYASNGATADFALVRYNADGSLDTSFGIGGKVLTAVGDSDDQALCIAVQPDGKIVVGGTSYNSTWDFALARYNADGTLDTSFSGDGTVITAVDSGFDGGFSVAIQPDGRIVLGGSSIDSGGTIRRFSIARYTTTGALDTSFSGDGRLLTDVGASVDQAYAIALQSDGRILQAGYSFNGDNNDFSLVRYTVTGALDPTFSGDGEVITPVTGSGADIARSLAVQRWILASAATASSSPGWEPRRTMRRPWR